jgi:hypothetical protein
MGTALSSYKCFEFCAVAVGISLFVAMDTFKFSVCTKKTAVRILIMSGLWAGRVQKLMAEILLFSAIQACASHSWKAKNGL